jgi:hypothetical protein
MQNDNLMRADGQELIRYLGDSPIYYVGPGMSILLRGSFMGSGNLQTLVFDASSRIMYLPFAGLCLCRELRSFKAPKYVRVIAGHCFDSCSQLSEVSFDLPATIRVID